MAGLDDLGDKLKQRRDEMVAKRKADWERINREHPDNAEFITAASEVFGKPKRVIVRTKDEVLMDSENYK